MFANGLAMMRCTSCASSEHRHEFLFLGREIFNLIEMEEKDRDPKLQEIVVDCIKDLVRNDYTVGVTLERLVYEALEKAHRLGWNDCYDDLKGKGRND